MHTKEYIRIVIVTILGFMLLSYSANAATLSPSINASLNQNADSDSLISVVIFAESNDLQKAAKAPAMNDKSRKVRHEAVIESIRDNSRLALAELKKEILDIYPSAQFNDFWIAPATEIELPMNVIDQISSLPSITAVYDNTIIELIEPVENNFGGSAAKTSGVLGHLDALNIPALWQRGITGKGRLVCNFDTGVEGTHPALASRWRGHHATASSAWFAPSSTVCGPTAT